MAPLENVRLKIGWAADHFNRLRTNVADYVYANPPKFVIKRKNPAHTEAWGTFTASNPLPSEISLIVGDILQTAHSTFGLFDMRTGSAWERRTLRSESVPDRGEQGGF